MYKYFLLAGAMVLCSTKLFSQEATVAAGGSEANEEMIVSYSIGQVFYTVEENSEAMAEQGVLHVFEDVSTSIVEEKLVTSTLQVYPNPFNQSTHLSLELEDYSNVFYLITDAQARVLEKGALLSSSQEISLGHLSAGVYFIRVDAPGVESKIQQIIKN